MQISSLARIGEGDTPITMNSLPVPTPGDGELLLRVRACGVCHTELDEIEGRTPPATLPMTPGHQVVGIVERAGPLLSISDGIPNADGTETQAPDDLVANNTLASVLIEPGDSADTFLFMRHLPQPAGTEGNFFPADGYAQIGLDAAGNLTLNAHGRHALITETRRGQPEHIDVAIPPPTFAGARTWHFDAVQKPWSQQSV